jgi:hypothetical protein
MEGSSPPQHINANGVASWAHVHLKRGGVLPEGKEASAEERGRISLPAAMRGMSALRLVAIASADTNGGIGQCDKWGKRRACERRYASQNELVDWRTGRASARAGLHRCARHTRYLGLGLAELVMLRRNGASYPWYRPALEPRRDGGPRRDRLRSGKITSRDARACRRTARCPRAAAARAGRATSAGLAGTCGTGTAVPEHGRRAYARTPTINEHVPAGASSLYAKCARRERRHAQGTCAKSHARSALARRASDMYTPSGAARPSPMRARARPSESSVQGGARPNRHRPSRILAGAGACEHVRRRDECASSLSARARKRGERTSNASGKKNVVEVHGCRLQARAVELRLAG